MSSIKPQKYFIEYGPATISKMLSAGIPKYVVWFGKDMHRPFFDSAAEAKAYVDSVLPKRSVMGE